MTGSILAHRPQQCTRCGVGYKTLAGLLTHECEDAPSYIALEALRALAPFHISTTMQANSILCMWARFKELSRDDIEYVLREVVK